MGNAESASFPFKVGDEVTSFTGKSIWKLFNGKNNTTGEEVSIFTFDKKANPSIAAVAQNAMNKLRMLRHPNFLRFVDGVDLPTTIHMVTERVTPLDLQSDELKQDPGQRESSLSLGIFQICSALAWLNNDGKTVHGNVSPRSIFVTQGGDWKLGGCEVLTPIASMGQTFLDHVTLPPIYQCPELASKRWKVIADGPAYAVDAWSVGCLANECFHGQLTDAQQLRSTTAIPKLLRADYKRLLSENVAARMNLQQLLKNEFFDGFLVQCVTFLENIVIKTAAEKETFFSSFKDNLTKLPLNCAKYKVLPALVDVLAYGSAMRCFGSVLGSVLEIGAKLSPEEYDKLIIPCVVKLFSSTERSIRVHLLQTLASYHQHLSADLVEKQVFALISQGFTDTHPMLRELTVKSMPFLVPKLKAASMELVLKGLTTCQHDKQPAIRTNTTYCLAKIAQYIPEVIRSKTLTTACVRSLKDPFPQARVAALTCFGATLQYYSPEIYAQGILPAIAHSTVDPVADVRVQALKLLQALTAKLAAHHEVMLTQKQPDVSPDGISPGTDVVSSSTISARQHNTSDVCCDCRCFAWWLGGQLPC